MSPFVTCVSDVVCGTRYLHASEASPGIDALFRVVATFSISVALIYVCGEKFTSPRNSTLVCCKITDYT